MPKTCTTAQAAVLDALPAHIALLDGQGGIISVNEAWRQFADANVLQAPQHGIGLNYLHICDRARGKESAQARQVAAGIRSVLSGAAKNFSTEYPCHSPAEKRWFQLTVTPLSDDPVSGAVVMHVNISERKRAEDALKALSTQTGRRERMLSTLLSSISDFAYIFDRDGRFLFANQPLLDLWGITLEAAVGRTFHDLGYPPDLAGQLQGQVREVIETGRRRTGETPYVSPSGLPGYYEYIFSPSFATDCSVDFVAGTTRDITERKQAEDAARKSQRHLRHLIDGLGPSMFVGLLTPQGILVEVNQSPLVAADLKPEDVLGKPFEDTHWWSHSPQAQRQLREAIVRAARGEASHYEVRTQGARGDFIDIDFSLRPLRDEAGEVIFLIPSANVITERKRAETALRESEAEFRTLAESMPQIVWITDAGGSNVYFNQKWMDYTGMTLEESLGHGWNKPFHPDDRQRAWGAWQHAVTTHGIYSLESRLRRADGAYRWWLVRGTPLLDAAGTILKWFGTCTDIHDLKQAELDIADANRALSENEQRYRSLFEHNPDAVYSLDHDGRIVGANAAYVQLTGYSLAETLTTSFLRMVAPEQVTSTLAYFRRALLGEAVRFESVRLHKSGRRIDVAVNYQPIVVQGAITGVYAVLKDITDRKRAEEALRKQQEFLAVLVESITDGIVACDADGVITLFNRATRELHGLSAEPVTAERWAEHFDLYLADGRTRMTREQVPLFRALRDGSVHMAEMVIAPRHGPARRVMSNGQATYDAAGRKTGAVVAMRDITEERRAEESIRVQAHMLDNIGQAVIATDLGGQITYANRFAEALYGWAAAEMVGRNVVDVTVPQVASEQAQQIMAQMERGENWRGEFLVRRRDGTDFPAYVTNTVLRDRHGALVGIVGVSEDISERKQAEAALRQQHAMLSNAQRVGGMGFWELDLSHNRLVWSEETYRLFGVAAETFGHTFEAFFALVHPDDAQRIKPLYVDPPSNSSVVEVEYRIRRPDGMERMVFERGEITRDADGRPFRKSGVVMDITERRRDQDALRELNAQLEARVQARTAELNLAREEADQANRAKSSFLAAMSHEIRTPMNGVIGMLDVLHQSSLNAHQVEMVDLICDSAFSLLGIIDDILDFSKMEVGKMVLASEPMRLGEMIEKGCAMLIQMAVKRGVHVSLFIDPAIPHTVCGDEGRLRQVLVNLVGNAIKFSSGREQPGKVSVRALLVERQAAHVVVDLVVADNGIGMNDVALARLFTPFSQADASTTRRYGGTGLGLAITDMLVQLMNGRISVRSALGQGATFTVCLRFATLQAPPADDAGRRHVEGLRCRIVGGEQPLADDLGAYLRHTGAIVERVPDLAAAAAMRAAGPTLWLILPDQHIPSPAKLRAMAPAGPTTETRFVVLRHGARRKPRVDEPDLVTVDADALARGTLFEALALAGGRVPRDAADGPRDPAGPPVPAPQSDQAPLQGALILVAEDNETNRTVILRQLQLIGCAAEVCVNGREALERWRSGRFALLLTDLHMPEMDGYELAAAIRGEEDAQHRMPIIALTANALRDEELRCLAAGMDAYLTKPVRLPQLKAMIEARLAPATRAEALQVRERASVDTSPPVDLTVLTDLVGNDPVLIDEVLRAFRQSASQCSAELSHAIGQGSMRAVADAAHKLKSAARSIGSNRLGQICADVEDAAHARRIDPADALVLRFDTELQAVLGFLSGR